jgi:hypothetical protein
MQLPTFTLEQLLILYVINQVSSALIQSMPAPTEGGNAWYSFIYKFLTLLVGDFRSFMTKLPALGTVQVKSPTGVVTTMPVDTHTTDSLTATQAGL